jgi:hypothetical protein
MLSILAGQGRSYKFEGAWRLASSGPASGEVKILILKFVKIVNYSRLLPEVRFATAVSLRHNDVCITSPDFGLT